MSEVRVPQLTPLVWTEEQVGELLQVGRDTVLNLHRTRQLSGVKIGKHLRFRPVDVTAFVAGLGEDGNG